MEERTKDKHWILIELIYIQTIYRCISIEIVFGKCLISCMVEVISQWLISSRIKKNLSILKLHRNLTISKMLLCSLAKLVKAPLRL